MADIYDLIDPQVLTGFARQELADEDYPENQLILGRWFPSTLVNDIDFEYSTGTSRTFTNAMPFRSWTTEAPLGSRPGRAKRRGEMPPLSLKFMLTELDRIRQRAANSQGGEAAMAIEGDVLQDISSGIRALQNRMEICRADAVVYGSTSIAENGVQLDVDFLRDAAREDTVSTAWSDAANATPIDDEDAVVEVMLAGEGLGASDLVAVMNRTTVRLLKNTAQYRNAAPSLRVHDRLPVSAVNEVRNDFELPPIVEYNASTNNYDGTVRKLIPDGYVVYLPANARVGSTQYGVPAVADEPEVNLERDDRPGPAAYLMRTLDPLTVWTVIDAIGIPVLQDPNSTYSLDVAP